MHSFPEAAVLAILGMSPHGFHNHPLRSVGGDPVLMLENLASGNRLPPLGGAGTGWNYSYGSIQVPEKKSKPQKKNAKKLPIRQKNQNFNNFRPNVGANFRSKRFNVWGVSNPPDLLG